ncbi:amino acid transporter, partial [Francisella tularensis subsp. holarctica]|nr:amino acid transporter [Francisella tularensis subsp. holarctica]
MTFKYTNFKILEVSGVDTKKLLQGLTTADLNGLSIDNDILLTAFAN